MFTKKEQKTGYELEAIKAINENYRLNRAKRNAGVFKGMTIFIGGLVALHCVWWLVQVKYVPREQRSDLKLAGLISEKLEKGKD